MAASVAQIRANQANAAKSTGPKTPEGKEASRQNSYKHGLTGDGIVLSQADSLEIARRTVSFCQELAVSGDIGYSMARRAAVHSVRMERAEDQQAVAMTVRVRQVEADFVAPEGASAAEAAKLRDEAARLAMFDPSKEATLARQYEAAAERGFYKALKELRQMRLQGETFLETDDKPWREPDLGSFSETRRIEEQMDAEYLALFPDFDPAILKRATKVAHSSQAAAMVDVPITIGKRC